jgi:hypothetical protein
MSEPAIITHPAIQPLADHGQTLSPPQGKVIGFFDSQAQLDAFARSAKAAGYPQAKISVLFGDDGICLLERLKEHSFFFSDNEDGIIHLSISQLQNGRYAVSVEVADHKQAVQIANLALPYGGHSFNYFGTFVSEQLTG